MREESGRLVVQSLHSSSSTTGSIFTQPHSLSPISSLVSTPESLYMSPYSARPCFELRYSFLQYTTLAQPLATCTLSFLSSGRACAQCANPLSISLSPMLKYISPLNSPLHRLVTNQQRNTPEQNLIPCSSECVEDGGVEGAGEGRLSVGGEAVVDDAFLRRGA